MTLDVVARENWTPHSPPEEIPIQIPANYIFCTNTHTSSCYDNPRWGGKVSHDKSVGQMCHVLMKRLLGLHLHTLEDFRYSFVISPQGLVYEGTGWYSTPTLPSKVAKSSRQSIFIGYMETCLVKDLPEEMFKAGRTLIENGIKNGFISKDFLYYDISYIK